MWERAGMHSGGWYAPGIRDEISATPVYRHLNERVRLMHITSPPVVRRYLKDAVNMITTIAF